MPVRVEVEPDVIVWARERAGLTLSDLERRFPKLDEWEAGRRAPTLKQLEGFAKATHTPFGYLLLPQPPEEAVPIPDYRTFDSVSVPRPSPDLLDTIYQCQQRQDWYRDFARVNREPALSFIGSLSPDETIESAARTIRAELRLDVESRGATWAEALRTLVQRAEDIGVLVMVNGVVGSDTHRKLDVREFRGFALVDDLAPLVFVNGADTKAAQIFTLIHELAHLWIGETGLSDADIGASPSAAVERWCNRVAAEVLVPLDLIRSSFQASEVLQHELERLARRFKVSTLVVLRRVYEAAFLTRDAYHEAYAAELERIMAILQERPTSSGGDFYNTQPTRVSRRFARALIANTLEGQTLYRDAFRMLGFRKLSTFNKLATRLGVD